MPLPCIHDGEEMNDFCLKKEMNDLSFASIIFSLMLAWHLFVFKGHAISRRHRKN